MDGMTQVVTDQTFDAEVLASAHPVLVEYWAARCVPCRIMRPLIEQAAAQYAGRLMVVTLDADENPVAPTRFGVRGFPTFMIFRQGRPVDVRVGSISRGQLQAFIEAQL